MSWATSSWVLEKTSCERWYLRWVVGLRPSSRILSWVEPHTGVKPPPPRSEIGLFRERGTTLNRELVVVLLRE